MTLEALGKLLERIDKFLYVQKEPFEKVVKIKERTIQTSIGLLRFKRRYYYDENEDKYRYKLDAYLNIPKRNRLMDSVKIKIIEAASEMSYEKAGRYACEDNLPVCKATVCRLLKNTEFYVEDNNNLLMNDSKVHIQVDEKFVHVIGSNNKKRLYTATIFKGITIKGKKKILQNKTLISSRDLRHLFKRINKTLIDKYKVRIDDSVYISGDLATYIQNSPERIRVCKAIYVPDKFHILKGIKDSLGVIASVEEINNKDYQSSLIDALKDIDDVNAKKIRKLLKDNPDSLIHYLDSDYDGCSQECMNSHYFCPRFDKVPNTWNINTIEKISQIICCKQNNGTLKMGWNDEYYDMPYETLGHIDIEKEYRKAIVDLDLPYQMRKFFARMEGGWDIIQ